ncbi:Putative membrane-bound redox modulator Alx [Buchnera aphidicola (Eriosoma grossulariae)]
MNSFLTFPLCIELIFFVFFVVFCNILLKRKYQLIFFNLKSACIFSFFWIFISFLFAFFLWLVLIQTIDKSTADSMTMTYISVYLLEKFLSIDNVCIWFMIFKYFSIPLIYQYKVLMYGIFSAIFFRIIITFFGLILLFKYHWVLYFFSLLLLFSGLKIIFYKEKTNLILKKNKLMIFLYKIFRITNSIQQEKFFIKKNNILYVTPLFVALIMIEISDIFFSIDSITAIFSITNDPFIIITSNIFSIFGLRSIYFLLALIHHQFHSFKYGFASILIFIGIKTLILDFLIISIQTTLFIIVCILIITIIYNIFFKKYFYIK